VGNTKVDPSESPALGHRLILGAQVPDTGHTTVSPVRNIGGSSEVVEEVSAALEELLPAALNPVLAARGMADYLQLRTLVPDRPGHDRRYAIDCSRIERELGWTPRMSFSAGIRATVRWYLANLDWCERVQNGQYGGQRLGLSLDMEA